MIWLQKLEAKNETLVDIKLKLKIVVLIHAGEKTFACETEHAQLQRDLIHLMISWIFLVKRELSKASITFDK